MGKKAKVKDQAGSGKRKKSKAGRIVFNVVFYTVLLGILVAVFAFFSGSTGSPRSLMGYSAMTVLTSSMQDELPQGSLIITKQYEPSELKVGDDITFLRDATTTVTHRITEIYDNYANTGYLGFQTKGIMNSSPDKEIVLSQNVVGKVIFHNLVFGQAIAFVQQYGLWLLVFGVLGIAFIAVLRFIFAKPKAKDDAEDERCALATVEQGELLNAEPNGLAIAVQSVLADAGTGVILDDNHKAHTGNKCKLSKNETRYAHDKNVLTHEMLQNLNINELATAILQSPNINDLAKAMQCAESSRKLAEALKHVNRAKSVKNPQRPIMLDVPTPRKVLQQNQVAKAPITITSFAAGAAGQQTSSTINGVLSYKPMTPLVVNMQT